MMSDSKENHHQRLNETEKDEELEELLKAYDEKRLFSGLLLTVPSIVRPIAAERYGRNASKRKISDALKNSSIFQCLLIKAFSNNVGQPKQDGNSAPTGQQMLPHFEMPVWHVDPLISSDNRKPLRSMENMQHPGDGHGQLDDDLENDETLLNITPRRYNLHTPPPYNLSSADRDQNYMSVGRTVSVGNRSTRSQSIVSIGEPPGVDQIELSTELDDANRGTRQGLPDFIEAFGFVAVGGKAVHDHMKDDRAY